MRQLRCGLALPLGLSVVLSCLSLGQTAKWSCEAAPEVKQQLRPLLDPYSPASQRPPAELLSSMRQLMAAHPEDRNIGLAYALMLRSKQLPERGNAIAVLRKTALAPAANLWDKTIYASALIGTDTPAAVDTEALLSVLDQLQAVGNSLFVVEHDLDVIRHAGWIVDVGPAAGEHGGFVLYNGAPEGLREVEVSQTRRYLFAEHGPAERKARVPSGWLRVVHATLNNLHNLDVAPLGVMTSVTGISGSGKSTLVSQILVGLLAEELGTSTATAEEDHSDPLERQPEATIQGQITAGMEGIKRLVQVDQRPIGRTPRSNLATYTGFFDHIRRLFAATSEARARNYDAGQFSFNVSKGRCSTCEGEGFVMVELLFLPSVYAPCSACQGTRYKAETLEIQYRGKNIAEVLNLTVDAAWEFFGDEPSLARSLNVVREVGLGYLRLGQPATELSGGEAQRIKLATELQRIERGNTIYILDEPTTGLHPADVERLVGQLDRLVDAGNTVVVVEHDMRVIAASDWIIDIGPGAGSKGGKVVASAPPREVSTSISSRTAPFLAKFLG